VDPEPVLPVLAELLRDASLWLATLLLADAVHSRRALSRAYRLLAVERARSEWLLCNMLPDPMPDHAGAAAEVALEMLNVADRRSLPDGGPVRLRIGIASGPVVAGVIGRRRFSYDRWGDTVNTASWLETTGVSGCIQVTERTRELLGDRYLFQERGMIQVKGKGKMLTYFLSGRARKHDQMLDLTEPH
jgi:hypothetical protein